ncbi:hypothetical protein BOTBODRAFT_35639 [Botryobasidium botryosum FD-172 SS1]|uniref:Histone chaperone RTT106/FACT complex subunit SPT16-like middle domain-containing protein n=1 Tax=Botryobasidium botryosum (strain FD-172 SS1) TaxID=930990 RepID=A0A067MGT2_BOTB1|nr:hypothetical protein BOTBODRAFT_35639 [Botryobasidium botryosum FD-172 SS1]
MASTAYLDTVSTFIPYPLSSRLDRLYTSDNMYDGIKETLDLLLRFCLGAACPPNSGHDQNEWAATQLAAFAGLKKEGLATDGPSQSAKRLREEDEGSSPGSSKKRSKVAADNVAVDISQSLCAMAPISVTSPVRKKLTISIDKTSMSFVDPAKNTTESTIPLSSLHRAFLLSTPGKSKPHWTVVILSDNSDGAQQIIFGIDATSTYPLTMTSLGSGSTEHPKASSTEPLLLNFLSHLPPNITLSRPSTSTFKSTAGHPHVDTYLRAKDGHLYFLPFGLLFGEKKPCEYIDTQHIKSIHIQSASGRSFSLIVTRTPEPRAKDGMEVDGEEAETETEGEQIEFSLIDGREMDGVKYWIQKNMTSFGKPHEGGSSQLQTQTQDRGQKREQEQSENGVSDRVKIDKGKGVALPNPDDDSSDDEDFNPEDYSDGEPPEEYDSDFQSDEGDGGGSGSDDEGGDGSEEDSDGEGGETNGLATGSGEASGSAAARTARSDVGNEINEVDSD